MSPKKVINVYDRGHVRTWENAAEAAREAIGQDATEAEVLTEICAAFTGWRADDPEPGEAIYGVTD